MESAHWIYVLLVLATMPPMVPNSALVAGAGAMAATGGLSLRVLVLVLMASTVVGDLGVFWAGRKAGGRVVTWLRRRPRRRAMLERTAAGLERYGVPSVIAVRFVPGGRGVGGLTAGVVGYPVRSYLLGAVLAEAVFVSYTVGLGYLGGRYALDGVARWLIGPLVSLLVAGAVWVLRRVARGGPAGTAEAGRCAGIAQTGGPAGTAQTGDTAATAQTGGIAGTARTGGPAAPAEPPGQDPVQR
ncbi:DedA family protein [Streptomyces sp. WMMB 322]|uniref:DedA family protein n=1 Tax=Streptomyces sp. WMMB 322 TaxID=1286821 RepID=UPI0006E1D84B|nr:VTT domain-containing protein [Streptomyces sp. WMMB 322]SCK47724.1 membrane protein DedA, SNARE-associated domain [Streptomyces sp. WMMB 322]